MSDKLHDDRISLITAVHWMNSEVLSVGFDNGIIKLIDVNHQEIVNTLSCISLPSSIDHMSRVNALSSTWDLLSSAGRDYTIINHDPREKNHSTIDNNK
jgi:hypothetical protein